MKPLNILGLAMLFLGSLAVVGFGLYKFFEDSNIFIVVKMGIIAIILGVTVLLISLTKERLKEKNL